MPARGPGPCSSGPASSSSATSPSLAALAPWIAPHPWDTISIRTRFLPPNATYWLGTDDYGRDVLSRLLMGARLSLGMGIGATLFSLAIGVPLGLAAGYFRGWVDEVLMRAADVLMAIPPIMLGLLVLAVTPPALWKTAARRRLRLYSADRRV